MPTPGYIPPRDFALPSTIAERLAAMAAPTDPVLAELRALREDIADLHDALVPKLSAIATGIEVEREYRRLATGGAS
jgi:hypothetical protein